MFTRFDIYVTYLHTLPPLLVHFLLGGSACGISFSLLLLGYVHTHGINYHGYTSTLWIKFQLFSRSAHSTRHPTWMPQSLSHLLLSSSRCMMLSAFQFQSLNLAAALYLSLTTVVQGVHSDYSKSFLILFSSPGFLPSSLPLTTHLFSFSLKILPQYFYHVTTGWYTIPLCLNLPF